MGQRIVPLTLAGFVLALTAGAYAADAPPPSAPPVVTKKLVKPSADELRAKAKGGDAIAAQRLAQWYRSSEGGLDLEAFIYWTRQAADAGYAVAQYDLVNAYRDGDGVDANPDEAARWLGLAIPGLLAAAKRGDPDSLYALGIAVGSGDSGPKDVTEAARLIRRAAERGDAEVQYLVGICFYAGDPVKVNYAEAARWLTAAADRGHLEALNLLAHLHFHGRGVPKNASEAIRLYRRAAEQGHAESQEWLGDLYRFGLEVEQNFAEAVRWHRLAAEQGNLHSQWTLGEMYRRGGRTASHLAESERWYRVAVESYARLAEHGDPDAQCKFGDALLGGLGVFKDTTKAVHWFQRSAEQGYVTAQYRLGCLFADGLGVPRSDVLAFAWLTLARAGGWTVGDCESRLKHLEATMLRAEVVEAQRIAAVFVPKNERPLLGESRRASREGDNAAPKPRGSGSGFAIAAEGYVITSQHVVASASRVEVVTRSGTYKATVVKSDQSNDVAVLKVEARLPALAIVPSKSARLGATVGTVGFPNTTLQGFSPKLSKGEIASLAGPGDDPRYFQISVAVQPGNSGGPLFDERGNVVGIVAAKLREEAARATSGSAPENVNYAIKSSFLLAFLESIPGLGDSLPAAVGGDAVPQFEDVVKTVEESCVLILVY